MVAAALRHTFSAMSMALSPADGAVDPVIGRGNRALDDHQVLAFIFLDDAIEHGVGVIARAGHDHLVVLPGKQVENDVGDIRVARSQHGFRASGAILELQPDQHGLLGLADGGHGLRQVTFGQRQHVASDASCRISPVGGE